MKHHFLDEYNMNTLLLIRPELFSMIIMLFLILYDRYCARFRENENTFFYFALACMAHCIMAFVTEITVNMEEANKGINDICHILFFLFSLLYALLYMNYALSIINLKKSFKKIIMIFCDVLCCIFLMVTLFAPIHYLQGEGTKYSAGIGPTLCYMLGFVFFIAADILIVINHKKIKRSILFTIIPLSCITLGLLLFQIIIPEFLYTAQALTITAVGLFFAIENPVEKFKKQAFIDMNSKVWNRNCYEYDLEHYVEKRIRQGAGLTYVMGDVNGLKVVNDNLSHNEGDMLIETVAKNLQEKLPSAYKVYRVGGDEFVALCFDTELNVIEAEVEAVCDTCRRIKMGKNIPVGISIGYAQRYPDETIDEAARRAEKMLYEKKRQYYSESGLNRRRY